MTAKSITRPFMSIIAAAFALTAGFGCAASESDRELLGEETSHSASKADGIDIDTWAYYTTSSGHLTVVALEHGVERGSFQFTTEMSGGLSALVIEGPKGGRLVLREDNFVEENTLVHDTLTTALVHEFANDSQYGVDGDKADGADACTMAMHNWKRAVGYLSATCTGMAVFATPGSGLACATVIAIPALLVAYYDMKKQCN